MSTMLKRAARAGCWATVVGDDGQLDDNSGVSSPRSSVRKVTAFQGSKKTDGTGLVLFY